MDKSPNMGISAEKKTVLADLKFGKNRFLREILGVSGLEYLGISLNHLSFGCETLSSSAHHFIGRMVSK